MTHSEWPPNRAHIEDLFGGAIFSGPDIHCRALPFVQDAKVHQVPDAVGEGRWPNPVEEWLDKKGRVGDPAAFVEMWNAHHHDKNPGPWSEKQSALALLERMRQVRDCPEGGPLAVADAVVVAILAEYTGLPVAQLMQEDFPRRKAIHWDEMPQAKPLDECVRKNCPTPNPPPRTEESEVGPHLGPPDGVVRAR